MSEGDGRELRGDVSRSVAGEGTYVHGDAGQPQPPADQGTRSGVGRNRKGRGGPEQMMVPREKPTSYYGRPIVKPPVWKPEIPFYFFFGGLAGASAVLASAATFAGRPQLARRAWAGAFVGVSVSPLLLIKDLGKPSRFLNMLRVFKITSPMNVGAWLLLANGGATSLAAGLNLLDEDRRGGVPELLAAGLGAPLATYTAALVTHSAIPAWSEARMEMPFIFAASATASAAGAAMLTVRAEEAEPARRLAIAAAIAEEGVTVAMHKRLGPLAEAYEKGKAGRFGKAARVLTVAGAAALAAGDEAFHPSHSRRPQRRSSFFAAGATKDERRRARLRSALSVTGGALLLAGSVCKRWSVFKAGFNSAEDPTQAVRVQRERIEQRGGGA
jgi:formate-dependent nitrite reductase membrane component NrfD